MEFELLSNPDFRKWLLGQSVALVIMTAWIWTLLRQNTASRLRNEKLSDYLVQHVENAMRERLAMADDALLRHDSTVRNILATLSDALSKRQQESDDG